MGYFRKRQHVVIIAILLLAFLAMAGRGVAQSQDPPADAESLRFLEARTREPLSFLHQPGIALPAGTENDVVGLNLSKDSLLRASSLRDWSEFAFASYRDSNWEIYTALGDGTSAMRITNNPATDSTPSLNRGATRIVFVSTREGSSEIYSMNANGSDVTRLTFTAKGEYLPTWSPDGSKIAFVSNRDSNYEIYVMNADGSNQQRLTSNSAWDAHPAWSPDGSKIVFESNRNDPNQYQLWTMNADGSNQQLLSPAITYAVYPKWSPDGTRIAFNDDANNDTWQDLAVINVDSTGLTHPVGFSPANYDYRAPTWSPDGQQLAFTKIQWKKSQGNWYWVNAYILGLDLGTNLTYPLINSGYDWFPDWQTTDVVAPSSRVTSLPLWQSTPVFTVQWTGTDAGSSGIATYDVQYRDGPGGTWTDWITHTTETSAAFSGQLGHVYYFQSRARDNAGNLEAYPGGDGDTLTHTPSFAFPGRVLGNRDQPIAVAAVQATPPALNTALSDQTGTFNLYFMSSGTYTLSVTRDGFGPLPAMHDVVVSDTAPGPTFYLPPIDDRVTDGNFEAGNLSAWNPAGDVTPTLTSTAHTGNAAALLGGSVPSDTVGSGPWRRAIEQEIALSPTLTSGTLSVLYQVIAAEPLSDTLYAYLIGPGETVTYTLPLTSSGWTHAWWDLPAWDVPIATLRIELALGNQARLVNVAVDEVSLGSAAIGAYPVYLPVVQR